MVRVIWNEISGLGKAIAWPAFFVGVGLPPLVFGVRGAVFDSPGQGFGVLCACGIFMALTLWPLALVLRRAVVVPRDYYVVEIVGLNEAGRYASDQCRSAGGCSGNGSGQPECGPATRFEYSQCQSIRGRLAGKPAAITAGNRRTSCGPFR